MQQFNLKTNIKLEDNYNLGLLPQRNNKDLFYQETSSRSNLSQFKLSSENRRIINKTSHFTFEKLPLTQFKYTSDIQKQCHQWVKELNWNFPTSSIKNVFTNHIFNYVYIWKNQNNNIIAYSLCYFSDEISHIAYVFYNPEYTHQNLPIRLVLQVIVDSHQQSLKYCYLGRFSPENGFYKRNMPGFQYFDNKQWIDYNKTSN